MNDLIEAKSQEIANTITNFESYLQNIGLPVENVIAPVFDRANVIAGIPSVLATIPASQIDGSVYLSRFVAASSIGLFDAALNYIWNEVIETLRNKVDLYGLDTFFDNCIKEAKRELYSNKEDLSGIKDKTLLETLKKLDWISDVIYLKLSHILDMRNQIGASHPNTYNVNGYELLGWLQVCVNEVIASKPSQNAIESKRFLSNIQNMDKPIDQVSLTSISNAVSQYPRLVP